MKRFIRNTFFATAGTTMLIFAGCEVDYDDVADARHNVAEERKETDDARRAGNENIREEKRDVEEARHTVNRTPYDQDNREELREQQEDVREARENKAENVREEMKETAEAEQEAARLEHRLKVKNERDAYIAKMEQELELIDKRINAMQERLEGLEGEAYDQLEKEIDNLQENRETFADAIEEVDDVDLLDWETKVDEVEAARKRIDIN